MTLAQLITQQKRFTAVQLSELISTASSAPFSGNPLQVDEPLWGSFWQFDVLAPGSTLPAAELALLRAIRLDQSWPAETTLAQFLADLHAAIANPQTGIWTTMLAEQPCAVFASAVLPPLVVWYCATTGCLHAGYRVLFDPLHFAKMTIQRAPGSTDKQNKATPLSPSWLVAAVEQHLANAISPASQLDIAILQHRLATTT